MKIGIVKEIKESEYRVGAVPPAVTELVRRGPEVFVETKAGVGSGFSDEDRIRIRKEILETTAEDLLGWIEPFRDLASSGSVCVIGPKSSIDDCDGLETVNV